MGRAGEVHVFQIHDWKTSGEGQVLDFNLTDVLDTLGERVERWAWCVQDLEAVARVGAVSDVATLCRRVAEAGPGGLWLDAPQLQRASALIHQIVDGRFFAFPKSLDRAAIKLPERQIGTFHSSRAEVAIWVVDATVFEIFTRERILLERFFKRFKDVRLVDPEPYFS